MPDLAGYRAVFIFMGHGISIHTINIIDDPVADEVAAFYKLAKNAVITNLVQEGTYEP